VQFSDDPLLSLLYPPIADVSDIVTTTEYRDGKTYAEWVEIAEGVIEAELVFPSDCLDAEGGCSSLRFQQGASDAPLVAAVLILRAAEVQWQVPTTHEGTYFKVWFDVLEEPDGWDATIDDPDYEPPEDNDPPEPVPQVPKPGRPNRSWYAQDVVREWTGPGENGQDDPSWLIGDPYEIPPPDVPGTRRIVNIRFECYRGPYGNLPQVVGEGVEL
jgi:hypothetical protein